MPRRRSNKNGRVLREANQRNSRKSSTEVTSSLSSNGDDLVTKGSATGGENCESNLENVENCALDLKTSPINSNTAELYNELDSFRQKWKRELEENKQSETSSSHCQIKPSQNKEEGQHARETGAHTSGSRLSSITTNQPAEGRLTNDEIYAKAKKLFLMAVELEQDDMHHESIRYYKQAMHLCPDIEKQIFQEQRLVSALDVTDRLAREYAPNQTYDDTLLERIRQEYLKDNQEDNFQLCRPALKTKGGSMHISDLPQELILNIYRYVIGAELDLASLENLGLVCRGFFILSRDQGLWRSICHRAYGYEARGLYKELNDSVDWRKVFLEKPRVNYDGVYISRTRYIRQGDVGFQDITYRPFHVIRYYRYLRFFPDGRVLILTTNEEPDKIIPIFRHALHRKQFSPELSILEGSYELLNDNQISIVAEKDFKTILANPQQMRRHEQLYWSRQTPQIQKFILKFKLDTLTNRPYRNNVLKWLEYTILARFDTGQEVTSFDLSPDTFPNLWFARVKRFNLKLASPLPSH